MVVVAVTLFVAQVGQRMAVYFQYKTNVDVEVKYVETVDFPSVTICNQNNYKSVSIQYTCAWWCISYFTLFYCAPMKLRESNVFTSVCHSVHRGWVFPLGRVSMKGFSIKGDLCVRGVSMKRCLCEGGLCEGRPLYWHLVAPTEVSSVHHTRMNSCLIFNFRTTSTVYWKLYNFIDAVYSVNNVNGENVLPYSDQLC